MSFSVCVCSYLFDYCISRLHLSHYIRLGNWRHNPQLDIVFTKMHCSIQLDYQTPKTSLNSLACVSFYAPGFGSILHPVSSALYKQTASPLLWTDNSKLGNDVVRSYHPKPNNTPHTFDLIHIVYTEVVTQHTCTSNVKYFFKFLMTITRNGNLIPRVGFFSGFPGLSRQSSSSALVTPFFFCAFAGHVMNVVL